MIILVRKFKYVITISKHISKYLSNMAHSKYGKLFTVARLLEHPHREWHYTNIHKRCVIFLRCIVCGSMRRFSANLSACLLWKIDKFYLRLKSGARNAITQRWMKGKLTSLPTVDLAACKTKGVLTGNTPGVLDDTTADLVLTLLLATARRVPEVSVPELHGSVMI